MILEIEWRSLFISTVKKEASTIPKINRVGKENYKIAQ
jgi:hypothetical protein